MHPLLTKLKDRFPDAVLGVREEGPYQDLVAQVEPAAVPEIAQFLHDHHETAFDLLSDILSVDYPEDADRFEVIYLLKSLPRNHRLRLKARLPEDNPTIPTVTTVWKGANFLEREVYDLMGIKFSGHPDLRRILLPEDYEEGHPLRKDFPTEGRGWRSSFPFLPRLDEPASPAVAAGEIPVEQHRPFLKEAEGLPEDAQPVRRQEELLLNMGPQHPATHGVLRIVLELEGERSVKATPDLGYLHRGVDSDFTPDLVQRLNAFLDTFPDHLREYDELLLNNRIWLSRTKNVAVISAEDAINFGCTGPVLRGSGVAYDVRKAEPYGAYDKVEWEVPIGKNGDTYDRYWVRLEEMRQSAKIIRQCLQQLPDGPIIADVPQVIPPPKQKVMRDMESLIHHFIIFTQGFKPPKGETYCASEAPKGELGFFIVSDGGPKPYRLKIRAPSFVHLGAFDHMARGYLIADIVTIFGTYDVVMGECDR